MISNQNDLNDIESRSGDLKSIAFNVRNNADQLRKEANRRNIRIIIIVSIVTVAIIAAIVIGV